MEQESLVNTVLISYIILIRQIAGGDKETSCKRTLAFLEHT
jgi:hypothetical protein